MEIINRLQPYELVSENEILIYNQPDCILPKSFFEGRLPPNVHPESLDYDQWWDEQEERCLSGWSDGGYSVTPEYYYHLNFKHINMLDENNKTVYSNPYFAFEDQELFQQCNDARSDGQGLMLVTGRGFGKSFDAATLVEHKLTFFEGSECIISASTDLFASNLTSKALIGLNSMPDEFRPSFLTMDLKKGYYETGIKGSGADKGKTFGYRSKLWKVVYDDDPGKTRGTRPDIHVFEEVGSWSGAAKLIKCYKMTEASWWRGSVYTSFPLLIGTGGQMEGGASEDAKEVFWDPESFNMRVFEWEGEKCAKFVPAHYKLGGFYENSGISDDVGARNFLEARRTRKKKNLELYRQETMEFPFDPHEAFQISGSSYFDIPQLEGRFALIERTPELKAIVKRGNLRPVLNTSGKMIDVRWEEHAEGIFEIIEHPPWRPDGLKAGQNPVFPENLYISGCDSFDAVEEELEEEYNTKSPGCCIMYKRFWKATETGRLFVAKITQRTGDASIFYWNTVKLNMYYSHPESYCKMLYEYTKIGIGQHYIIHKLEHLLYPRPKLDSVDVVKKTSSTNRYGIAMPIQIKKHAIINYGKWVATYIENMYFSSQIKDAIEFRFGSSVHDETMAASIALLADNDMYEIEVEEEVENKIVFPVFRTNHVGKMVFE